MYQQNSTLKALKQSFGVQNMLKVVVTVFKPGSSLSIKRKLPLREGSRSFRHNLCEACEKKRRSHRQLISVNRVWSLRGESSFR